MPPSPLLSKCCESTIRAVRTGFPDEGTNHYRCDLCNEPCDIKPEPTPYVPQVGDRVSVEGAVRYAADGGDPITVVIGFVDWQLRFTKEEFLSMHPRLISRPTPEREFMECDTCRAKPGSPQLCRGCLNNRSLIESLESKLNDDK